MTTTLQAMATRPELWVCQLGLVEYREALELQTRLRAARIEGRIPDTLLLLEHPPVYTRGRRTEVGELPFGADWYAERGIDIADVDRGGHVTYHGPGMLTGYTIMRVPQVHPFVHTLESALMTALTEQGTAVRRRESTARENLTGVWVEDRKIASIGLHLSRGHAMHGFAINVVNDLEAVHVDQALRDGRADDVRGGGARGRVWRGSAGLHAPADRARRGPGVRAAAAARQQGAARSCRHLRAGPRVDSVHAPTGWRRTDPPCRSARPGAAAGGR